MFKNYFITGFRNLWRNKIFSIINIAGFSIAMALCILIIEYIKVEFNMNKFLSNGKDIYRVNYYYYQNNELNLKVSTSFPSLRRELKQSIPSIKESARIYHGNSGIVKYNNGNSIKDWNILTVDTSFLRIFGITVIKGNTNTPLRDPNSALITEEAAKKYYGKTNPIGKVIYIHGKRPFIVEGVINNPPANLSIFKYSILLPYHSLSSSYEWNWYNYEVQTFLQLEEGTNPKDVEKLIPAIVAKNKPELAKNNMRDEFKLQCIEDIHLFSDVDNALGVGKIVFYTGLIALFIFVIACVNYINLSTARAGERAKEVGVRKVLGALTSEIRIQFLLETLLINIIAVLGAIFIAYSLRPLFSLLTERTYDFSFVTNPGLYLNAICIILFGTLASGFYTSIIQSSFEPVKALKGNVELKNGFNLRRFLMVFQFSTSIALIIASLLIYLQLSYMKSYNLGVETKDLLAIEAPDISWDDTTFVARMQRLRNDVSKIPNIESTTASSMIPGRELWSGLYNWIKKQGDSEYDKREYFRFWIDYNYFNTYGIKVIAGRNFSNEIKSDEDNVILNETAVKYLGFKSPMEAVGKKVVYDNSGIEKPCTILGVVNNYHQTSPGKAFIPLVFMVCLGKNEQFQRIAPFSWYTVKLKKPYTNEVFQEIEKQWKTIFPGEPFDSIFVDEFYDKQYSIEQKFFSIFSIAALVSVFIACFGLFGLSSYTTLLRTKEIGIRKTMGASIFRIVMLLTSDFVRLIIIAFCIVVPIIYIIFYYWLQQFANRLNLIAYSWVFIAAGIFVLFFSLLIISIQIIKTAMSNPVDSLRNE